MTRTELKLAAAALALCASGPAWAQQIYGVNPVGIITAGTGPVFTPAQARAAGAAARAEVAAAAKAARAEAAAAAKAARADAAAAREGARAMAAGYRAGPF